MPKLWNDTLESHHQAVHDAVLDASAQLVGEAGLTGITMSTIAERTGIGRATLYKYFPDVETIIAAWHERQIGQHLDRLHEIAARHAEPLNRLRAVLEAYAQTAFSHRHEAIAVRLHEGRHAQHAHQHLRGFVGGLIADAAKAGDVRNDIPNQELAGYCIAALDAAAMVTTKAAIGRLVEVTLGGLRPAGS
jgi:AcrR family transcriptional regulator